MNLLALLFTVAIAAPAAANDGTARPVLLELDTPGPGFVLEFDFAPPPAPVDLRAEAIKHAIAIAQERDPATGQFIAADTGTGFFGMMANGTYDPAVLSYFAASAVQIYSAWDLQNQCDASAAVECSGGMTPQQDAMVSAGVFAGVTGLQRLAKTQWDVDLDEGWKQVAIWGGMAAVRALFSAANIADANAIREAGR